ncbi:MAG: flagellar type III secretion system pore protein FliP [Oscillospiraceae bacterium]|jgi:flagellar biosynthetic protein FliP
MTVSNLKSKLKKPFVIMLTALIVFLGSVFVISGITAHAEAVVAAQEQEEIISEEDQGFLSELLDVNDSGGTLELVLLITVLSLAPSLLILMTCFTRIIIVFSLLRSAMGTQQTPPNQVLVGLALFVTFFVMAPVFSQINEVAYEPYKAGEYSTLEAAKKASVPLKEFMLKNTTNESLQFFLDLSGTEMPQENITENLGLHIVAPSFIVSELKRAFIIGFLLFIPFLIIDIIVSSTLMSMGMIMLPPSMIALPFKILLFIIVDGWHLLIGTLVSGFNV